MFKLSKKSDFYTIPALHRESIIMSLGWYHTTCQMVLPVPWPCIDGEPISKDKMAVEMQKASKKSSSGFYVIINNAGNVMKSYSDGRMYTSSLQFYQILHDMADDEPKPKPKAKSKKFITVEVQRQGSNNSIYTKV
jgi:hypothetical protein